MVAVPIVIVHGGISYCVHKNKPLRPRIYADTRGFLSSIAIQSAQSVVEWPLERTFPKKNVKCVRERLLPIFPLAPLLGLARGRFLAVGFLAEKLFERLVHVGFPPSRQASI